MRRIRHSMLACLALLLAGAAALSCTFRDIEENVPMLNLWVYVEQPVLTKATEGEIAASEAEKAVHALQIWVFRHSDGALVAYLAPPTEGLSDGGEKRFSTTLQSEFADAAAAGGLSVDVYALANAASIGASYDRTTSRATLAAATMTGNVFGTSTLIGPSDITTNGLPMSAVETLTMTGSDLSYTIPSVTLTRAVSKVRFVFCQSADNVNGTLEPVATFSLDGISMDSGKIPTTEYVFNNTQDTYRVGGSYNSEAFPIIIPSGFSIPKVENPREYIYTNQTAAEYEEMIDAAKRGGSLSQLGGYYFRESDRALSGTISFTVDGVQKTASFSMADPGDFARNHSWIVYAYFCDSRLYVRPVLLPWTVGGELSYATKGNVQLSLLTNYKICDDTGADPGQTINWQNVFVATTYALETYQGKSKPCSPLLRLITSDTQNLRLQSNNPNFGFIKINDPNERVSSLDALSNAASSIVINSGEDVYTYFYVVPTSLFNFAASNPPSRVAHIMLVRSSSGMVPEKEVLNPGAMPGPTDNTEIFYYYLNPGDYPSAHVIE